MLWVVSEFWEGAIETLQLGSELVSKLASAAKTGQK